MCEKIEPIVGEAVPDKITYPPLKRMLKEQLKIVEDIKNAATKKMG